MDQPKKLQPTALLPIALEIRDRRVRDFSRWLRRVPTQRMVERMRLYPLSLKKYQESSKNALT
jgi:hypothetical protein